MRTVPIRLAAAIAVGAVATALPFAASTALAACVPGAGAGTPPPGTTVNCTNLTLNQNFPNGYGDGSQNGLTINVQANAAVVGNDTGISVAGGNTINNFGLLIQGAVNFGIGATGDVKVLNSGSIIGNSAAIQAGGAADVTNNSGSIQGGTFSAGIQAGTNATVRNNGTGSITGQTGILALAGLAGVTNSGSITGSQDGIQSTAGGANVTNNGGTIQGSTRFGIFAVTDATVVNSGTIAGANVGVVAGGTGTITNNLGGLITGGVQGIVVLGGGSTVFNAGTITGGGPTAIIFGGANNVLTLAPTGTINGQVTAGATDTLQLGGSGTGSFDATLIGPAAQYRNFGSFAKTGDSTWTLTGTNALAMPWNVQHGTLLVNGSLASSTFTVNGGVLGGTGTVSSTTIKNGGTLAPGLPGMIGTLNVAGNLAFQAGALYVVQVNPANASRTNVSGSATLAGTVQAQFAPGNYVSRSYTILSSAGLGGTTFNNATSTVPGFSASLSYTATDVILNLTAALGAGGGLSGNQQSVANAINGFFNNGGALPPNFANVFGLSGGNLTNALSQLSGEAATGAQQGAFKLMDQFLSMMLDPFVDGRSGIAGGGGSAIGFAPDREALPEDIALAYAKVAPSLPSPGISAFTRVCDALCWGGSGWRKAPAIEQRWTAWAGAYGGYNRVAGDPAVVGSHDLTARTGGGAAGLDYHLSRDTVAGVALAGGGTNWSLAQGLGGGRSDAFQAGAYAATRSGAAYLAASLAFANHWMSTDRFAAFGDHLTADFNAQSFGMRVEGGYRFATSLGGVAPYAALQAQSLHTPGYRETDVNGGGFALAYNARTGTDTRSELGARFDHVAAVDSRAVLTLRGRLAWAHDWVSDPTLAAAFQALPGASFIVNGAAPAKDSALASAGAEVRLANGVTLLGKFDGEFARRSSTYAGTGTLRVAW